MIVLGFLMCLARIFFFILCRASLKCAGKSGFRSALPDYPDRYKSDQILCRKTLSKAGIKKNDGAIHNRSVCGFSLADA